MEQKTHWKKLTNQDYIGAYALKAGEDLTVTIKAVRRQEVKGEGGRDQECMVATLEGGHKPLILNATNSKTITKLYGPYIEDWAGKQITLYQSTTSLKGETVECLRIRPAKPAKAGITEERLTAALGKIEVGEYTVERLLASFELTDEQQARLPKQITDGSQQ